MAKTAGEGSGGAKKKVIPGFKKAAGPGPAPSRKAHIGGGGPAPGTKGNLKRMQAHKAAGAAMRKGSTRSPRSGRQEF